jgi:hypothetical protein
MVARLQRKFPIGLGVTDAFSFICEAFRRIDQMSKGGFVWQVGVTTLTAPAGAATDISLPADFDPGKTAWLRGSSVVTSPTLTIIPYKPYSDFYNQEHFVQASLAVGGTFSAWSYKPSIAGSTVTWKMNLRPSEQFPLANPVAFDLTYHKVCNTNAFAVGPAVYFPTPDQFDGLILDLAEAELSRVYGRGGWEKIQQQAMQGIADMVDTYRTERYTLAGVSDMVIQAQERQADKTK